MSQYHLMSHTQQNQLYGWSETTKDKMGPIWLFLVTSFENKLARRWISIEPFPKRQRLVHNVGFTNFKALYCSLNMVSSTEISLNLSYKVQSSKSQSLEAIQKL